MKQFAQIPSVYLLVEGKTEEIYLNHLKERGSNYSLHVERFEGNQPMKMVKRCKARFRERGHGKVRGDRAFCVLDVDNNSFDELKSAIDYAESAGVTVILSNACFESFFLLHFTDDLHLMGPQETKNCLKEYIADYTETKDCWHILKDNSERAVKRSRSFDGYQSVISYRPGSDIWKLFDYLAHLRH